ncbi:MAG TPA: hypothetical protein VGQ36_01040 [Thermoanaerobaculia bacterium]|jgi:hypothetical protein|nr:hypothetical protein [Thermoanaerobaculia bacterium]
MKESAALPPPRERSVTIIAQDPTVRVDGEILLAQITIPAEKLSPGPVGYRVEVVDFDAATDTLYTPASRIDPDRWSKQPKEGLGDKLVRDPEFHRHNVYALVMKTLSRFELALGRRINWGFDGHQLKVAPHAFSEANAFYSDQLNALLFGYFPGKGGAPVFTCLSHDIIVHETTHALIDGLRERYREPSSADQAAFHEGFADVVALLSVFSLPAVIASTIDRGRGDAPLSTKDLSREALRKNMIFGLAEQVGDELNLVRGPLRHSMRDLAPSPDHYHKDEEFVEAHRRGEILVAAMLTAFVEMWSRRLTALIRDRTRVDRSRAIEEGADIADCLLTSAIRALDYAPPVDVTFGDYLSALLTADREIRPADTRYELRACVRSAFQAFGIKPASGTADGYWKAAPEKLDYSRTHFDAMRRDHDEVFHFVWENRRDLGLHPEAFTRVTTVRPCMRVGSDGFVLHETVCEYVQILEPLASELDSLDMRKPEGMPDEKKLRLFGGGALIFDEYGHLKYHVYNPLRSVEQQQKRLDFLWESGALRGESTARLSISSLHLRRATRSKKRPEEEW